MKIKPEQTEQIASLLMASFKNKQLMVSKAPETMIKQKVVEVVTKNFTEEEEIEEEARKMLASVAPASRDMNPFKMFLLAKQKLAARKGFIL
jgi:hypothetical protein